MGRAPIEKTVWNYEACKAREVKLHKVQNTEHAKKKKKNWVFELVEHKNKV